MQYTHMEYTYMQYMRTRDMAHMLLWIGIRTAGHISISGRAAARHTLCTNIYTLPGESGSSTVKISHLSSRENKTNFFFSFSFLVSK